MQTPPATTMSIIADLQKKLDQFISREAFLQQTLGSALARLAACEAALAAISPITIAVKAAELLKEKTAEKLGGVLSRIADIKKDFSDTKINVAITCSNLWSADKVLYTSQQAQEAARADHAEQHAVLEHYVGNRPNVLLGLQTLEAKAAERLSELANSHADVVANWRGKVKVFAGAMKLYKGVGALVEAASQDIAKAADVTTKRVEELANAKAMLNGIARAVVAVRVPGKRVVVEMD